MNVNLPNNNNNNNKITVIVIKNLTSIYKQSVKFRQTFDAAFNQSV